MAEATDPFNEMDDSAAVMAYIHQKHGKAALAELLAVVPCSQESLIGDSELLAAMGLEDCAAIVAEFAANTPSQAELCPFDPQTDDAGHWDWNARQQRKAISRHWKPLPDNRYGVCNGLRPGERPPNWDIATKQ
jgi:hypothetical protein